MYGLWNRTVLYIDMYRFLKDNFLIWHIPYERLYNARSLCIVRCDLVRTLVLSNQNGRHTWPCSLWFTEQGLWTLARTRDPDNNHRWDAYTTQDIMWRCKLNEYCCEPTGMTCFVEACYSHVQWWRIVHFISMKLTLRDLVALHLFKTQQHLYTSIFTYTYQWMSKSL